MDNEHNVLCRFFVLVGISSSGVFERLLHSQSTLQIVFFVSLTTKETEKNSIFIVVLKHWIPILVCVGGINTETNLLTSLYGF